MDNEGLQEHEYLKELESRAVNRKSFCREELIFLRDRAMWLGTPIDGPLNPLWIDAHKQLAFACDRLDAMIARTAVRAKEATEDEQQ